MRKLSDLKLNNDYLLGEKEKLLEFLMGLCEKARREGLLSLESDLESSELFWNGGDLLTLGLSLIIDGVEPAEVEDLLVLYILRNNRKGSNDYLKNIIFTETVLNIQSGLNPRLLKLKLEILLKIKNVL